jgi:hypothetical protein
LPEIKILNAEDEHNDQWCNKNMTTKDENDDDDRDDQ